MKYSKICENFDFHGTCTKKSMENITKLKFSNDMKSKSLYELLLTMMFSTYLSTNFKRE